MTRTARGLLARAVPLLLLATACGAPPGPASGGPGRGPDRVTLTLNWYPYGEHAPFYYGKRRGIFAKYGIDLTVRAGQGSLRTVQLTAAGRTDFGWADTPALLAAVEQGVRVRSLGVFLQTTPACVQSFAAAGISSPADLRGRTVAGTAGDALSKTFPAFLRANGLAESDVRVRNTDPAGKVAAVVAGRADALLGYANDQGPTLREKTGKRVACLRFSAHGLDFYSDGLIAGERTLHARGGLARRMARAVSEAWQAARGAPEAAVAAMEGDGEGGTGGDGGPGAAVASGQLPPGSVLREQFRTTLTLLHTAATRGRAPGVNTEADWRRTLGVFRAAGLVERARPVAEYWDGGAALEGRGP
ncbi:ABC transporter substrate-binding protein [Streptomyces sp. NPDC001941]|uniref:ABC transporter substrate-binding protein n=1 Tax=Streptomyces sp. NPDC001941 TaxID=3154659 RepID=UPI00331A13C0